MSGGQTGATNGSELEKITRWRFEELVRAGFDDDDACELAFHHEADLHVAIELVRQGCPSRIAAQIAL